MADDLLTALLLARTGPVLLAPAMNDRMFAHDATRTNLETLRRRGWAVVGPAVGALAEGPNDQPGRMSEPEEIVAQVERTIRATGSKLASRTVLVTAGPTREPLDPVRVLTNRSSGRMGYALAAAGFARGADVVLVTGPTTLRPPIGVTVVRVETTENLRDAVASHLPRSAVLIMAAAPADYRPAHAAATKRSREAGPLSLELEPTADVLRSTAAARPGGLVTVGFALETGDDLGRARTKQADKKLDVIVHNDATEPGAGFEVDTNRITVIRRDGSAHALPLMSKLDVAEKILDEIEMLL
jgi:phosphopantothenoylcysteine decarboxylase/phosphopantothenate--cysteine ligase